jgi:hypothetical protein
MSSNHQSDQAVSPARTPSQGLHTNGASRSGGSGIGALPFLNRSKHGSEIQEEDEEIFTFFKKYTALLTAAGSLPLVTAGIDVISPPKENPGTKLTLISSLVCVIVLGTCILFKSTFTSLSVSRRLVERAIPPLLALLFLGTGIALTSQYMVGLGPNANPDDLWFTKEITYLLIQPCFVAALGITLMASYSQFRGSQLVKTIDQSFVGEQQIDEMKSMIGSCARIFAASTNPRIEEFHRTFLKQIRNTLQTLSQGFIDSSGIQAAELQKTLFEHFHETFYAVSDRDLKFWTNASHEAGGFTAKECLRLAIDAVCTRGVKVTRIFIFEDNDFNEHKAGIVSILAKHHEAGIGWAVLLHEELPSRLRNTQLPLDFALLDNGSAVASFNERKNDQRRFRVFVNVPEMQKWIEEYGRLHGDLIKQCWLANRRFCEIHNLEGKTLDIVKKENENKSHAITPDGSRVVMLDKEKDIEDAVDFIRSLRRKNMLYWDEVVSERVIDLEGDWTYTITGEDQANPFAYSGTCRCVIENKQARFVGAREQAGTDDQSMHAVIPPAPWQSSFIEFDKDWIEYKSVISVGGKEVRGIARLRFGNDRNHLKGGVDYIFEPGRAVHAVVEFHRQVPARQTPPLEHCERAGTGSVALVEQSRFSKQ